MTSRDLRLVDGAGAVWADCSVTVRASLGEDAVTLRARVDDEPVRLLRLAPLPDADRLLAGPVLLRAGDGRLRRALHGLVADRRRRAAPLRSRVRDGRC